MPKNVEIAIEKAFADVPPPAEGRLCASVGNEAVEDTEPFRGKTWRDLDPDSLCQYQYALFWFTPEAFHYYLQAFLRASLIAPQALYVITILQILQPTDEQPSAAFRDERWGRLTEAQVGAVEQWLSWLLSQATPGGVFEGEIKVALQTVQARFWW